MIQHPLLNKISQKTFDSTEFKKIFLLKFTKELIKHSTSADIFKLKNILKYEEKGNTTQGKLREKIKDIIKEKELELSVLSKEKKLKDLRTPLPLVKRKTRPFDDFKKLKLIIPETRFPPHLQYLKPIPIQQEIELGKIDPLIRDPFVRIIECDGPGQNLVVKGSMGEKRTGIILDRDEINETIKKIAEATKIPVSEGVYKVVIGKLIFLAIISEVIGSKFIIQKMFYKTGQKNQTVITV